MDFDAPVSTWVSSPPQQPSVTLTSDLLIRSSVGASEYSCNIKNISNIWLSFAIHDLVPYFASTRYSHLPPRIYGQSATECRHAIHHMEITWASIPCHNGRWLCSVLWRRGRRPDDRLHRRPPRLSAACVGPPTLPWRSAI